MSGGPDPLELIDDPDWLAEPLCGLPEEAAAEGHGLMDMLPGLSHWLNSSASTKGGRIADVVIGGAGAGVLSTALGAILHVPLLGSALDFVASIGLKKAGIDFSLKGTVNFATRSAAMALEGRTTGRRQGAAVLKAQALLGNLTDVAAKLSK